MSPEDIKLEAIRKRYDEIVAQAIEHGAFVSPIDLVAAKCSSGTGCCAGDGRQALNPAVLVARTPGQLLRSA